MSMHATTAEAADLRSSRPARFRRGDLVVVRPAGEILATLDNAGACDGLPFMPEMLPFCGAAFRVARRANQICTDSAPVAHGESRVRALVNDDVVLLEGTRCDGSHHGGCGRACAIFWKEAWLRPAGESLPEDRASDDLAGISAELPTLTAPDRFFCQSSELITATRSLSPADRLRMCWRNVTQGNYSLLEMLRLLTTWSRWRVRTALLGPYPRGDRQPTPDEILNLQPGEWVQVKPLSEIVRTLDRKGKNRGLHFSADMAGFCGRRLRVASRIELSIAEGTGRVQRFRNTVILDGAVCDSGVYAFGGCPREIPLYWREIWLRRDGT
jgi:hypothetical protein